MKNKILLIYIICLFNGLLFAQNKMSNFGKTFVIGASYTRIGDVNSDKSEGNHYINENTFNVNVSMKLSKKFWFGIQVKPIYTKQYVFGSITKTIYNFNGIYSQFDFVNKNGLRLYAESSFNLSNYCTCSKENQWDDPIKKRGLYFLGIGGGLEFNLNPKKAKNLYLELAFFNYVILNKIQFKYNYTQYILGLNYKFGKLI